MIGCPVGYLVCVQFQILRCNDAAVNVQTAARNRCCICCSPICRPRDSADSRHSLASNSWLSGKGRCCLRLCVQLCISSLLFLPVCHEANASAPGVRAVSVSASIHPHQRCQLRPQCWLFFRLFCPVVVRFLYTGTVIATSPRAAGSPEGQNHFRGRCLPFPVYCLTSFQLSGCVHTREDSPMSGDQIP